MHANGIDERRREVRSLRMRGKTVGEIATELGVSIRVIRSDVEAIKHASRSNVRAIGREPLPWVHDDLDALGDVAREALVVARDALDAGHLARAARAAGLSERVAYRQARLAARLGLRDDAAASSEPQTDSRIRPRRGSTLKHPTKTPAPRSGTRNATAQTAQQSRQRCHGQRSGFDRRGEPHPAARAARPANRTAQPETPRGRSSDTIA